MGQFREETRGEFSEMRGQLVDVNAALVQIVARLPGAAAALIRAVICGQALTGQCVWNNLSDGGWAADVAAR